LLLLLVVVVVVAYKYFVCVNFIVAVGWLLLLLLCTVFLWAFFFIIMYYDFWCANNLCAMFIVQVYWLFSFVLVDCVGVGLIRMCEATHTFNRYLWLCVNVSVYRNFVLNFRVCVCIKKKYMNLEGLAIGHIVVRGCVSRVP